MGMYDELREIYVNAMAGDGSEPAHSEYDERVFDAWYRAVQREAWQEGYENGWNGHADADGPDLWEHNPY